ncbi:uncharacterized protein LOC120682986 isoform X2 [Panicum virgatum]|uniref:Uncharacterized protein n=1 Tax=Panicum virgatum TaxID=38727 RepID=A0A8T0PU56_PANVG|nr:uncharacterized protein LOC120682986 isoform X2 [Panicum virgatum]KAG2564468.1 hypothetical protein PVAP13_7NG101485 [Panicum virgatum]KAG2564473.1 hypothetical protein PVAP13_7NG101485 [Panicum virgatum]
MGVLKIRINQRLLHCRHCHRRRHPPLPPADTPLPPANTHCCVLDRIIHQMRFKCNFCDSGYIPYSKFLVHLCDTTPAHLKSVFARGECILATSALMCSECGLPLRPPIFRRLPWRTPICTACCHNGDVTSYRHNRELEHLIQGITVKCEACKQYLPFSTFASHKLVNLCGENKQKAPYEVGKMDESIVHGDEVGNDDDSSGDNHGTSEDVFSFEDDSVEEGEEVEKPKAVKRVAENAFKTLPCDREANITMPYGQKPAPTAAQASASPFRRLPIMAPSKPPLPPFIPHRPGTRLFQAVGNKNRAQAPSKPPLQLLPCRPVTRSRKRALLTDGSTSDK